MQVPLEICPQLLEGNVWLIVRAAPEVRDDLVGLIERSSQVEAPCLVVLLLCGGAQLVRSGRYSLGGDLLAQQRRGRIAFDDRRHLPNSLDRTLEAFLGPPLGE